MVITVALPRAALLVWAVCVPSSAKHMSCHADPVSNELVTPDATCSGWQLGEHSQISGYPGSFEWRDLHTHPRHPGRRRADAICRQSAPGAQDWAAQPFQESGEVRIAYRAIELTSRSRSRSPYERSRAYLSRPCPPLHAPQVSSVWRRKRQGGRGDAQAPGPGPIRQVDHAHVAQELCSGAKCLVQQRQRQQSIAFIFVPAAAAQPFRWHALQATAEVVVTRRFFENFSGDQVRFLARGFSVPGDHQGQMSNGYRWADLSR